MEESVEASLEVAGEVDMDPFQKLPEEVVEVILEKLEGKDLASCSRTCKLFNRILEPTKQVWLLLEVLPLFANPDLLGWKDVVNLRKVCHEWRRAVDDWLEEGEMEIVSYGRSYKFAEKSHEKKKTLIRYGINYLDLTTCENLRSFREEVKGSSPFTGRRLTFGPCDMDNLEERYWDDVITFFEEFGGQVKNCRLFLEVPRYADFLKIFRKLWVHLPNIRKLAFFVDDALAGWPEMDELEHSYEQDPLLPLSHLESLALDRMPRVFYNSVFPIICSQLRRLEVHDNNVDQVFGRNRLNSVLSNLTSLSLTCDKTDLHLLVTLTCPVLTHLVVRYRLHNEDNLRKMLEAVHHFGSTLQELDIEIIGWTTLYPCPAAHNVSAWTCRRLNLCFPHLQILKLNQWSDSYNWLLCMPSLQLLVTEWGDNASMKHFHAIVQPGETVGIHGFVSRLFESNIWTLLPTLMEVRMKHEVPTEEHLLNFDVMNINTVVRNEYNREGYERHVKATNEESA